MQSGTPTEVAVTSQVAQSVLDLPDVQMVCEDVKVHRRPRKKAECTDELEFAQVKGKFALVLSGTWRDIVVREALRYAILLNPLLDAKRPKPTPNYPHKVTKEIASYMILEHLCEAFAIDVLKHAPAKEGQAKLMMRVRDKVYRDMKARAVELFRGGDEHRVRRSAFRAEETHLLFDLYGNDRVIGPFVVSDDSLPSGADSETPSQFSDSQSAPPPRKKAKTDSDTEGMCNEMMSQFFDQLRETLTNTLGAPSTQQPTADNQELDAIKGDLSRILREVTDIKGTLGYIVQLLRQRDKSTATEQ